MSRLRSIAVAVAVVAALCLAAWLTLGLPRARIGRWCSGRNLEIVESGVSWNPVAGPFWRTRNDVVFWARVRPKSEGAKGPARTSWFRFRLWWMDQAWEERTP